MAPNRPVFKVEARTLPEVWEKAVEKVYSNGVSIATEYDEKEESRDCTMIMVIDDPLAEPRIHRGALISGAKFYQEYTKEVLEGTNDHHVYEGKLPYTYHQRLFDYTLEDSYRKPHLQGTGINQIEYIIEKLSRFGFSRRAQAITWNPSSDPHREDPPCLQRVWCRIYPFKGVHKLIMNTHWRSRDAYNASFLNMFALTLLQKRIAEGVQKKTGQHIEVGQYVDISDSFHIYQRTLPDVDRFLKALTKMPWSQRTWTTQEFERKTQTKTS
ncbi:MAG: thymidylate synthase [Candidatus Ranarchaeia archaeon]